VLTLRVQSLSLDEKTLRLHAVSDACFKASESKCCTHVEAQCLDFVSKRRLR
jgi:hypothetical protein